jgi:hypothetical protein
VEQQLLELQHQVMVMLFLHQVLLVEQVLQIVFQEVLFHMLEAVVEEDILLQEEQVELAVVEQEEVIQVQVLQEQLTLEAVEEVVEVYLQVIQQCIQVAQEAQVLLLSGHQQVRL